MRAGGAAALCATAAGALVAGLLLPLDLGHWTWAVSRSAGLLAYLALTGSVAVGLSVSNRLSRPSSRPFLTDLHSFLGTLALVLLGIHAAALVFDSYRPFSVSDLLFPFAADYRREWTAAGVTAGWISVIVAGSFWLRSRRRPRLWRRVHILAFPAWLLGLLHGLGAGTDTGTTWVYWGYVLSAATVAALVTWRVASAGLPASTAGAAAPGAVRQRSQSGSAGAPRAS